MGPFDPETKIVFNLASGAAQIYYRLPLTDDEIGILINKLSSIEGVNRVFDRDALDQMNTPANLGDLVVDCKPGYAFSVSKAEHGSYAQTETFMLFSGYNIKKDYIYEETCRNVDIVPTIYYINDLNIPGTVDGKPLLDILEGE